MEKYMKNKKRYCPYNKNQVITENWNGTVNESDKIISTKFMQTKISAFSECKGKECAAFVFGRCKYKQ